MLEKPAYRDNLERLDAAFPDKENLTIADVARWLGKGPRLVKKVYDIQPHIGISKATLARKLS